jgi:hypothetical protein
LRRIVLLEARAREKVTKLDGLWRRPVRGLRGATARPGSMTQFIREQGLLPEGEIARIIRLGVPSLKQWVEAALGAPEPRPEVSEWLDRFDSVAQAGMPEAPSAALRLAA